jgi:hypothetical protein
VGGEPVTLVEPVHTMQTTRIVRWHRREEALPAQGIRNARPTTVMGVLSFQPLDPPQAPPELAGESSGQVDASLETRSHKTLQVREKFDDVFQVSDECEVGVESDFESYSDDVSVAGRLSDLSAVEFFRSIGASQLILNKLRYGHHPDLISEVPPLSKDNNGSFRKHIDFATKEVRNLIASGRVEIVEERPHCVLPLHVVVQPRKNRLILDCSALNKYIKVPKIKYDDYKVALNYFRTKGYIFTFDFKDGFYHIKIHPDFTKFLGFSLVLDGRKFFCQFKVGFLGLADLPWLFTKIF